MSSLILLYLFIHGFISTMFSIKNNIVFILIEGFHVLRTFQTDRIESSTQSSPVIHNYCSIDYPVLYHSSCTSAMSHFSSLIIIYFILGVRSGSLTFLVPISANCRPPSHQSNLCILNFINSLQNALSLKYVCYVWYL